jgi:GGDEF domain-containing protein
MRETAQRTEYHRDQKDTEEHRQGKPNSDQRRHNSGDGKAVRTLPGGDMMSFARARSLLLLAGLILILLIGLVAISRGVDLVEVTATLLFIPVFVGFLFRGLRGGFAMGVIASVAYVLLRIPSLQLIGLAPLAGQISARIVGYLGFGLGGGWAAQQIKAALDKFELHDDIDDETGIGNARSMLEVTDTEKSRADRYQKVFSVVLADVSSARWSELPIRKQRTALRELGQRLEKAVRGSDHIAHARRAEHHLIGLVLPETGPEGARIASENMAKLLSETAGESAAIRLAVATYPGDGIEPILELWRELDRARRPADRAGEARHPRPVS